jgi:hypothetical protein
VRGLVGLSLGLAVGLQGCTSQGCTHIGGEDGVFVEISRSLYVARGAVAVEVCDEEGCATATQRLGPVPQPPVGRAALLTFDDLGKRYEPGRVTVGVELTRGDGAVVARVRRDVELTRSYPNGTACDGEGYVGGSLVLRPADRV